MDVERWNGDTDRRWLQRVREIYPSATLLTKSPTTTDRY